MPRQLPGLKLHGDVYWAGSAVVLARRGAAILQARAPPLAPILSVTMAQESAVTAYAGV